MTPPLGGIRVLDLSRVLAGPYCTMTLADLGAEVWKVEHPAVGDDTRTWRPPEVGGVATDYLAINRSKKGLAIDLKRPTGLRLVHALAERADVLVANFLPATLRRFGLAYDQLAPRNPRLVHCTISGYGLSGSRAEHAGYDMVIQAESGLMSITGEPDGDPVKVGVAIADLVAGMNAIITGGSRGIGAQGGTA